MKRIPRVVLTDATGLELWAGSLHGFFRSNDLELESARGIVAQLRPRPDTGHLEPAIVGGGAAGEFRLLLEQAVTL